MHTILVPHSVPSTGGPFLVLQNIGLSSWLHHSVLHTSKFLNCWCGDRTVTWKLNSRTIYAINLFIVFYRLLLDKDDMTHKKTCIYILQCIVCIQHRNQIDIDHPSSIIHPDILALDPSPVYEGRQGGSHIYWIKHTKRILMMIFFNIGVILRTDTYLIWALSSCWLQRDQW